MQRLWRTLEVVAWAAFFALAAAVLVLRYAVLPHIERLRPGIVERVSAIVGQRVTIGGVEAQWLGLRPQVNLTDVRIYDAEGREALVLPSVENILSWRSLARGTLSLYALHIDGPRLVVRRDAAGALYVAGIKLVATPGEPGLSDWLSAQRDIEVRNAEIEWHDEKRAAPPLVLSSLSLRLNSDGEHHRLGFAARLPENLGTSVEVRAELAAGDIDDLRGWNGRAYAQVGYTDVAAWRPWLDSPLDVERGQAALRLWISVAAGMPSQATADVALAGVRTTLAADLPVLELGSAVGRLQARREGERYALGARHLALAPESGAPLAPLDFDVAWQPSGGVLSASALELAPLAHLGQALPLPAELRMATHELAPRGRLADLRYEWQGPLAAPTHYQARSRFVDLGIKARETFPGFAQLAGTLEASEAGGRVQVDARGAELELPRVFPDPRLAFDVLAGELAWKREGASLSIEVPSLTFTNADLSGNAFGSYVYDGNGPGKIDVSAVLSRADAKSLPRYLPLGVLMGEKPREWLVKGILAGEAMKAELRLKGDLRSFPFADAAQGEFSVMARVRKGVLEYARGWPRIDDIDAEISFQRNRMDIAGKSGTILGVAVHDVKVSIPDLGARAPRVLVSGQAHGATAKFLQFLSASPLRTSAGRFTEAMSASGDGKLRLKLELPLADLRATRVAGEYELAGNEVTLLRDLPPLAQAQGTVAFTESTLALREVRARAFGGPVSIAGGTRRAGGAMEFVARGEAQPAQLARLLDDPLRHFLSGSTPYVVSVTLRDDLKRVSVESSLRGVAAALPAPFEKAAADALPLRVDYVSSDGGARERIAVFLGRLAAAEVRRVRAGDTMQVQRAALSLSPAAHAVRLPERGVLIYGSTAALDLDRWRGVFASGGASGGSSLPVSVELKAARVDLLGKRLQNVAVRGNGDAAGWSAVVDADELAGQLAYQAEGAGRLVARLLHLSVPPVAPGSAAPAPARASDLPALDIAAESFNLRGKDLGRLELVAVPEGADWRIDKLALASADATLDAKGRWRGAQATDLDFSLHASDVGKFLARIGYPDTVRGGKAELAGSLTWAGEPSNIDYQSLTGEIKLTAEDGQFLEIDPGFGKLISLMNLQALPRRITLDFRDVFSKGFRFDRIEAASAVDHGVMDIRQFRMRGPAAEVRMSGRVDLAHETQTLKVRVVPSLGGSASTAVAIVNPVAGVAAALAQKVLKDPLGQLFAHEFDVSGNWADPKVVKVTVAPTPTETATQ
jgi:uncharacterized protein (TIGR02099 family)